MMYVDELWPQCAVSNVRLIKQNLVISWKYYGGVKRYSEWIALKLIAELLRRRPFVAVKY